MGRAPCCDKNGMKKGPWTPEEDERLMDYIQKHGHGSWRTLPKNAGLARCGKSCRLRWTNYLRPDIKRGRFSFEEEEAIIQLHSILGNKWSAIAAHLPGRTDNEIKNYWNTHIRKRLLRMGIDPVTHSPRLDLLDLSSLLSPAFYNPAEQLMNSELLRITNNLLQQNQLSSSNFLQNPAPQKTEPMFPVPCPWQDNGSNFAHGAVDNYNFHYNESMEEQFVPNFVQEESFSFQVPCDWNYSNCMQHQESLLSTPASSPTMNNSCSTYLNGSTEDDRDSYCSSLFQFQIPDLLDASEFM